jgi:multidrug efflux pump subunit AcrA (membrane-fusion protein)
MNTHHLRQFLTVVLTVAGWSTVSPAHAQRPTPQVAVTKVIEHEVPETITVPGTVMPKLRSTLAAEIGGLVRKIDIRAGDDVKESRVVCELENRTLLIRKQEAETELAQAKSVLEELEAGSRLPTLTRLKAAVGEARALHDMWEFEKKRVDDLFEGSQGSEKEVRDTKAQALAAEQRLAQAEAAYELALEGERKEKVDQARLEVIFKQLAVQRIEDEIRKTRVLAPYDGSIIRKYVEVGEWVNEGGQVAELISLIRVLVLVQVPESAIPYLHVGDPVRVTSDALKKDFMGQISHIIAQADDSARTFPIEIVVTNDTGELKSGMFVRATLRSGPRGLHTVVPKDAVVHRDGFNYVSIVEEQGDVMMAFPTPVKLGGEDGHLIAVTSDRIRAGTTVVTTGNERLQFPTEVEVTSEKPAPASQPVLSASE